MREIHIDEIINTVQKLCIEACCYLNGDVKDLLNKAFSNEKSELGKNILQQIQQNIHIAETENIPLCQDTGMAVVFLDIGQDVHITGGSLDQAINEGVRRGYELGFMRKSVLDPITRINTKDNTPAVIHYNIVKGDKLRITVAPKGFGSENMSSLKMLKPSQGIEGVKEFVLDTVLKAGASPCPPIIVGVGIGGTMEKAALMAKQAILRKAGMPNRDPNIAQLERELLELINKSGIGPQGLGGTTTALAVHVETYPTHIAGLPVAVNMQCHVARHRQAIL